MGDSNSLGSTARTESAEVRLPHLDARRGRANEMGHPTWEEDELSDPINEQTVSITEFRGSGRGRYLTRQRDLANPTEVLADTTTWYDYDGDEIYGDYEVDVVDQEVTATQIGVTQAGIGQVDYNDSGLSYFHSDHIGSTRLLTDSPAPHTIEDSYIYTAFGERIHADGTIGTRYRYAGAYGYQDNSAFAAPNSAFDGMHVGHRYYSPSTGRFLQRDPIGLAGGINTYDYVRDNPTRSVDPSGLQDIPKEFEGFFPSQVPPGAWPRGPSRGPTPKKKSKLQKLCSGAGGVVGAVFDFVRNLIAVIGIAISPAPGPITPIYDPSERTIAGIDALGDDEVTRAGAGGRTSLLFSRDVFL